MNYMQIGETFLIGLTVSYLITPFVKLLAVRLRYLDYPKDNKVHARPVPLLGGVAIFIAFIIAVAAKQPVASLPVVRAIIAGTCILLVIGLIDDKMGMMPNLKLLGQFLAAMVIIKAGVRIGFLSNYYVSVIVTYIWIIGITNAFNLLDNMNGLSAGIAGIAAVFFGFIAYTSGQDVVSVVSCALAGSAFGFLKYNFPKASLFMGDSGSLVLGYLLAAVSILGSWKGDGMRMSSLTPILVLGYPIFDTVLVSVMRIIEGRSIFQGGKDHSSHRLALLGLKRYRTVLVVYLICVVLGLVALAVMNTDWRIGALLTAGVCVAMCGLGLRLGAVGTKRFGRKRGIRHHD